ACTTGSATSASSSATRTSRRASRMFSSVSRPRPRKRSIVVVRRWVRASNMARANPGGRIANYNRPRMAGRARGPLCETRTDDPAAHRPDRDHRLHGGGAAAGPLAGERRTAGELPGEAAGDRRGGGALHIPWRLVPLGPWIGRALLRRPVRGGAGDG